MTSRFIREWSLVIEGSLTSALLIASSYPSPTFLCYVCILLLGERGITQTAYFCSLYSKQWKNFEENHFYALR